MNYKRTKTLLILWATPVVFLIVLLAVLLSVRNLYYSLAQVRSIYSVDVKELGLSGELQYQIQESRRHFLPLLIPGTSYDARLMHIGYLRKADLQVDLLRGAVTVLTADSVRLRSFEKAWSGYGIIRDDVIALSLQGRFSEALALEQAQGAVAFDVAAETVRHAKRELDQSSAGKTANAVNSMFHACLEILCLVCASALLVCGLFASQFTQMRMVRKLRLTAKTLSESEERFSNAFEDAAVGIVIMDLDGRIVSLNKAITEITDYSAADLIGHTAAFAMPEDQGLDSANLMARVKRGEISHYVAERKIGKKDGTYAWLQTSVSMVRKDSAPAEIIVLCEDVTKQKLAREQLSHQATHDLLTGLANRRYFETVLEASIVSARARQSEIALLYIDLDGFKLVNDTLGHSAGDLLLKQVAERLRSCLDDSQFLARVGGDEFTVIQRSPEGRGPTAMLGRRILECLHKPFVVCGQDLHIGASMGISCYPLDGLDGNTLLQSADAAMYHAKRHDSSGLYFFDTKMREAALRKLTIDNQLRSALERHELYVHFQPVYETFNSTLTRFEALCRWRNPPLGEVSPTEFIPVAEEIGLIANIGNWVLREACVQALKWQNQDRLPIRVAVNVSALQFAEKNYVDAVEAILLDTGLSGSLLELELTESTLLRDRDETILKMERLRNLGISISIDDFGTGYSSFSYVLGLPVDALKIDRSFTMKLESSPSAVAMTRSVIAMSHALGLRVVTEGVETERQLEILQQLGSDEVQGYYFGKPENCELANQRAARATVISTLSPDAICGELSLLAI